MKRKTKGILSFALSVAMAFSLAACGSGNGGSSQPAGDTSQGTSGGGEDPANAATAVKEQLDIALTAEIAVYDLHKTSTVSARIALAGTVFEQLVTLNGNDEPVPELCESYEVNDDATQYTFYLREGVLFHDGSVMAAADVVASMNRWIDLYSAAGDLLGGARFEALDDSTVTIQTEKPCITLLYLMAGGAQRAVITTEVATQNLDDDGTMKDLIGTGPYVFAEWVIDQYVMLERFENYVPYGDPAQPSDGWAGYKHAHTPRICLWVVPEEATRVAGIQTGQYDSANVSDAILSTVLSDESIALYSEEGGQVSIVYNKKSGLCVDENMRKAINAIIDADEIMVVSYGGSYTLGSNYMEANQPMWYTTAGSENYNTQDYAAAQSYLEAAGYNGEALQILVSSANNFNKLGEILAMELEAQGVNCEITTVDWGTFTEYRNDSDRYDLFISSFAAVPVPSLKNYFGADYAGWTDDTTLTALWEGYSAAATLDEAADAWVAIQEYCWDYLPITNIGHYLSNDIMNAGMEGVIYYNGAYYWNAFVPVS